MRQRLETTSINSMVLESCSRSQIVVECSADNLFEWSPTQVEDMSSGRLINFSYTSGKISSVSEAGGALVTNLTYSSGLLTGIEERDASSTLLRSLAVTYNGDGTPATVVRDGDSTTEVDFAYTDSGTARSSVI